ncbi:unnamed protein product [Cyprideis torosa]|uniref:Uncharacterized protein n=1 Tax=Cyprideis torosa TaxID=163714 RepID=A0A7R8WHW1_9CRUS|nr:unnamed protein product [Cyprideis torosa]CAG0893773.1 unnamed protein product [Cyprideis torosa]
MVVQTPGGNSNATASNHKPNDMALFDLISNLTAVTIQRDYLTSTPVPLTIPRELGVVFNRNLRLAYNLQVPFLQHIVEQRLRELQSCPFDDNELRELLPSESNPETCHPLLNMLVFGKYDFCEDCQPAGLQHAILHTLPKDRLALLTRIKGDLKKLRPKSNQLRVVLQMHFKAMKQLQEKSPSVDITVLLQKKSCSEINEITRGSYDQDSFRSNLEKEIEWLDALKSLPEVEGGFRMAIGNLYHGIFGADYTDLLGRMERFLKQKDP